jgi:hypothetical protein
MNHDFKRDLVATNLAGSPRKLTSKLLTGPHKIVLHALEKIRQGRVCTIGYVKTEFFRAVPFNGSDRKDFFLYHSIHVMATLVVHVYVND